MNRTRFGFQILRVCLVLLILFVLGHAASTGRAAVDGFHISGRFILDANGTNFIMRGVNHGHNWFPEEISSFRNIKAKGANTVRVVLSSGKLWDANSAADVTNVINVCKSNRLVCVLEVHDTTGYEGSNGAGQPITLAEAVNYWISIKNALLNQEAYVIINIGNEPFGNSNTSGWVNATKNAIAAMRTAGFKHLLMVDAPNWGQDWELIMQSNAASVLASDPEHNTVFSIHMYEVYETASSIQNYVNFFVNAGLPLVIGEFGPLHEGGNPDEDTMLAVAQAQGIGYLGWSWSGNSPTNELDMVLNFDPNQETSWGKRIFRGPNGICRTSVEASIYGGDRDPMLCEIERLDPTPTSAASVRFNMIFNEPVTGVDVSAPFIDFSLTTTGVPGAYINSISGPGATRTVTVKTAPGSGTLRLNLVDNDSVRDANNHPLGGPGAGNGSYTGGAVYTVTKPTNVRVTLGGSSTWDFSLATQESTRQSFTGANNGPLKVAQLQSAPVIAAERVIYRVNGVNTSFTEIMGHSQSQLDTTYWLPWYNNVDLDTQLRIANVSGAQATVNVYIAGILRTPTPITLAPGVSTRQSFQGVNDGPVRIVSNQNIVVAERVIYKVNTINTSYTEMMALPARQLDTTYWLPWYNNVDLDTQLRIANVSSLDARVQIFIGNMEVTPVDGLPIPAGTSTRVHYAGANDGPVRIVADQNIVAAERVIYKVNGIYTSFSEMMAMPANRLDKTYWLPWYNNVGLDTQLRIANAGSAQATVRVYVGGVEMSGGPIILPVGASLRKSFPGVDNGPVQIVGDQNLVAAERVIYKVNAIYTSFTEMMGLPDFQLDSVYWFPWYNNVDLDTQLRFGRP